MPKKSISVSNNLIVAPHNNNLEINLSVLFTMCLFHKTEFCNFLSLGLETVLKGDEQIEVRATSCP